MIEKIANMIQYHLLPVKYRGRCYEIPKDAWEVIMQMVEGCDSDD